MVAITVILAAVIAAFVFGLAGTTSTSKNVGLTVALTPGNLASVTIQGGTDLPQLSNLSYRLNGTATEYAFYDAATGGSAIDSNNFPMKVGQMVYTGQAVTLSKVSVIGHFKDGTTAVLIDRQF